MGFLRLACTCEETCESVWPPIASLYASSTCALLRLLAGPFDRGFIDKREVEMSICGSIPRRFMFNVIKAHDRSKECKLLSFGNGRG